MSFGNALNAGINLGNAIAGPFAQLAERRMQSMTFPLQMQQIQQQLAASRQQQQQAGSLFPYQVQSLKASIAGEEARSSYIQQQTKDLTQIHDLLSGWLGKGNTDPSLEQVFQSVTDALTAQRQPGFMGPPASAAQLAGSFLPRQPMSEEEFIQNIQALGSAPGSAAPTQPFSPLRPAGMAAQPVKASRPVPADIAVRQPPSAPAKSFAENVRSALLHAAQTVRGDPTSPPVQMAPYVSSGSGGPSNFGQMPEPGWMANLLASGALPDQEGPSMSPGPSLDEALRRLETARVMAMKQPDVPDPLGVNPAQQAFQAALKDVYTWLQMVGPLPEAQMYGPLQQMYGPAQEFFPTYGRRIGNVPYANRPVPYGPQQMPQFTRTLMR
jgi:hypothetical protein